jgi:hypothetical protein
MKRAWDTIVTGRVNGRQATAAEVEKAHGIFQKGATHKDLIDKSREFAHASDPDLAKSIETDAIYEDLLNKDDKYAKLAGRDAKDLTKEDSKYLGDARIQAAEKAKRLQMIDAVLNKKDFSTVSGDDSKDAEARKKFETELKTERQKIQDFKGPMSEYEDNKATQKRISEELSDEETLATTNTILTDILAAIKTWLQLQP